MELQQLKYFKTVAASGKISEAADALFISAPALSTSIPLLAENGFQSQHNFLLAYECEIPPASADKLDSIFLFRAIPTVMVHKDHPFAQKETLDIRELMNERLFLPMPGSSLRTRIQQLFELHGLPFPSDNFYTYMVRQKMVAENKGISFLSQHPGYTNHTNIRYIPLIDPCAPWNAGSTGERTVL